MKSTDKIKIFLSSTYLDLAHIRSEIAKRLSQIFGVELIIMETFGSDTIPPNIKSVRRVRECDLFVGIYAHRYGKVDKTSGESITELELDEAKRAFSSGSVREILLYTIDIKAKWPEELIEKNNNAQLGLQRLKEKAREHTCSLFKSTDELLFSIISDIRKKIDEHFSVQPIKIRFQRLPHQRVIRKPLGMEFFTSADRDYLLGRDKKIDELMSQLNYNVITLLLGESGVGKTSLIHAGLLPKLENQDWVFIYTRPFGLPNSDIVQQIQNSIFEGQINFRGSLVPILAEVLAATNKKVLLIIDQFEDILISHNNKEVEELIKSLVLINGLANSLLHILISYRADLEGRLGEYWQKISGSPNGLSRVYLSGLSENDAWQSIEKSVNGLSINIELRKPEKMRIVKDLSATSQAAGFLDIYPPYLQMLIDHIWISSNKVGRKYNFRHYMTANGMGGVINGYLSRQLGYARDTEGHIKSVLTSLVRSYGIKAQKTMEEIVADTGLEKRACEIALERLMDLRLIRHIDCYYEVSHDFLAKKITAELVDSEEKDFKRFRELLMTKAAAYQTTKSLLTREEMLILFKYKERVIPNEQELLLILASWIKGIGPGLYWILRADPKKILDWLRIEETKKDLDNSNKVSIILLRKKIGDKPLGDQDYLEFRDYKLSAEMATLILENPFTVSNKLLTYGLRHKRDEVRKACSEVIVLRVKKDDWDWITLLRKSSSKAIFDVYIQLVQRADVRAPEEDLRKNKAMHEFTLLKEISFNKNKSEASALLKKLVKINPLSHSLIYGKAFTYIRQGRIKDLLSQAESGSVDEGVILLDAISGNVPSSKFKMMLNKYKDWNSKEKARYDAPAIYEKANALASAIARCAAFRYLPLLRKLTKQIRLTSSSREIIHALLRQGNLDDFESILRLIAKENKKVDFWNHTELGRTAGVRSGKIVKRMPRFLVDIVHKREFWDYIPSEEREKQEKRELLSLASVDNRALYIRLAAFMIVGAANKKDQDILVKLSSHSYGLIAAAAAMRLVTLFGDDALKKLSAIVDQSIKKGRAETLSDALRYAERQLCNLASLW